MEFTSEEEFLFVASHELRTPVTALRLQLDFARKILKKNKFEQLSNEQLFHFLNRSSQDLEKLSHLIEELLDASSLEQKLLTLHQEYALVDELFWNTISRLTQRLKPLNVALISQVHTPVLVRWDLQQIGRVIHYIIDNGVRRKASEIALTAETGGGYVYLQIQDNGEHLTKEQERSIFNKTFSRSYKKSTGSLGLGTYLAKEIIELHKGEISVKSDRAQGTIFKIMIPTHP